MFFDLLKPYPGFFSVFSWYFRCNYIVVSIPFGSSDCTTKDGKLKGSFRGDVMVCCFHKTVLSRVSVPFKLAVIMKSGFPVAVMVTIGSYGLYIEDWIGFFLAWREDGSGDQAWKCEVGDWFHCWFVQLSFRVAGSAWKKSRGWISNHFWHHAMLSEIGEEGTDARVHVQAIYYERLQKHAVIREPSNTWRNHIACNATVTWQ